VKVIQEIDRNIVTESQSKGSMLSLMQVIDSGREIRQRFCFDVMCKI